MAYVFPPPNFSQQIQPGQPVPARPRFSPKDQRAPKCGKRFEQRDSFHRQPHNFRQRSPSQPGSTVLQTQHHQQGPVFPPPNFAAEGYFCQDQRTQQQWHQGRPFRHQFPPQGQTFHGPRHHHPRTGQSPSSAQWKKKNKPKKEQVLPFYCESCDRGFKTQEKIDEHKKEHVKCKGPECKFEAHWKVVRIHFQHQHGPGSKKIGRLETKEEIAKWREARRKNFPTAANIAKKKEAEKRRVDSGQVLKTKSFGKMGRRQKGQNRRGTFHDGHARGRPQKRSHPGDHSKQCKKPTSPAKKVKLEAQHDGNDTTAAVTRSHDSADDPMSYILDKDSSDDGAERKEHSPQKVTGLSALGVLAANYGSDSEASNEEPIEVKSQPKPTEDIQPQQQGKWSKRQGRRNWKRERKQTQQGKSKNQMGRGALSGAKRKPTLLEMLLAPEIRHERNVVLQCVRYIRKNHFFNVGKPSTEQAPHTSSKEADSKGHASYVEHQVQGIERAGENREREKVLEMFAYHNVESDAGEIKVKKKSDYGLTEIGDVGEIEDKKINERKSTELGDWTDNTERQTDRASRETTVLGKHKTTINKNDKNGEKVCNEEKYEEAHRQKNEGSADGEQEAKRTNVRTTDEEPSFREDLHEETSKEKDEETFEGKQKSEILGRKFGTGETVAELYILSRDASKSASQTACTSGPSER
ncbi:FMR1-interacting protein NUFIP1-like [Ptychodera flava]|uniref:FMR1-interacting protein NUFIP1-like n=1 Tax=Ptychodera flava TaxID=63121 RepID=UPI003969C961